MKKKNVGLAKHKISETGNRSPGICVTGRDVTNYTISDQLEYLGFDPSTSCLLSTHASDCANTPYYATPGGFEPPRAEHTHLAGEPLNHSGKVSKAALADQTYVHKKEIKGDWQKATSPTGIRTRVAWVKTMYPDQLDYWG